MVIVITGPIASGKSTIARALADELARRDVRSAVIDLDVLHDMLTSNGRDADAWAVARRAAAALANTFAAEGVAVVIADGSFNAPDDRAAFDQGLEADDPPLYVTLRVSYEEALRRAQRDPTRGVSRDPAFLGPYFAAAPPASVTTPATDIVIDTERTSAMSAAAAIARLVQPGRKL